MVGTKSGAVLPRCETGFAGSPADLARSSAKARFLRNSAWTAASSSWKTKPPGEKAASEFVVPPTSGPLPPESSTVNACVPYLCSASPVMSPLVV